MRHGIPCAHLTRLLTESVLMLNMGMPADLVAVLIQLPAGSMAREGWVRVGGGGASVEGKVPTFLHCRAIQPVARLFVHCGTFGRSFSTLESAAAGTTPQNRAAFRPATTAGLGVGLPAGSTGGHASALANR